MIWHRVLRQRLSEGCDCVLVTLARARGSTPREAGAKMVVWADGFAGSIGGGNLEFAALARARELLSRGRDDAPHFQEFSLGPALAQCCGGSAGVLFELFHGTPNDWLGALEAAEAAGETALLFTPLATGGTLAKQVVTPSTLARAQLPPEATVQAQALLAAEEPTLFLKRHSTCGGFLLEALVARARGELYLYGAGHVGRALVRLLADLPIRVTWVDARPLEFPDEIPANAQPLVLAAPLQAVTRAPAGAFHLVMTHSHQLDLALCEAILHRADFAYLGLIGSASKRARFENRLRDAGFDDASLARLVCPIGVSGIPGKTPPEIAIAVAAQLLRL